MKVYWKPLLVWVVVIVVFIFCSCQWVQNISVSSQLMPLYSWKQEKVLGKDGRYHIRMTHPDGSVMESKFEVK